MGVSFGLASLYLVTVFLCIQSQSYNPYGQYGYTPYIPYNQGQNVAYNPYPYPYSYQPYVSSQSISNSPYYGYPSQSHFPQSYPYYNYPVQSYPAQTYPEQSYPAQTYQSYPEQNYVAQNYPNQYAYPQYSNIQPAYTPYPYAISASNDTVNSTSNNVNTTTEDPYANIKVDVIDIDPRYFTYYKKYFNLEDNTYPVEVIDDDSLSSDSQFQSHASPQYIVKTESKSYNFSSVPQGVNTHDVQSKTFSYKRTFTLDPSKKENAVINLNFVNGVQITTEATEDAVRYDEATTDAPVVTDATVTTTESEEPDNIQSWFRR